MSKFHKTKNYRGPCSPEDAPMNKGMVKLILRSVGFSSAAEVRAEIKKAQKTVTLKNKPLVS
tara:strand:- start:13 stop:198 length:186 start_codon:yes stop_codon:yes gene_type:complete